MISLPEVRKYQNKEAFEEIVFNRVDKTCHDIESNIHYLKNNSILKQRTMLIRYEDIDRGSNTWNFIISESFNDESHMG